MDMMSLVSAQMSAQMGRAQMTVAASIMKTNAGHDAEAGRHRDPGHQIEGQISAASARGRLMVNLAQLRPDILDIGHGAVLTVP